MKRYEIISTREKIKSELFDQFVDGLRIGIKTSLRGTRAVFVDGGDLIHAMSWGGEFKRLIKNAKFVGVYDGEVKRGVLGEDISEVLTGG